MRKSVLARTNFLVCIVIIIGYVITSLISYRSNQGIFRKDIESVSTLTSEGIYHQIDSVFTKPIHISMTMASDSLLMDFLEGEQEHLEDQAFINTMGNYLNTYRDQYGYDSVFLASVKTRRYYCYNGIDRILNEGDPENIWFYDFLEKNEAYDIVIDNDQVDGAGNQITIFINCRIQNEDGDMIGVVGVGFCVDSLQTLLKSYETNFGVSASLVNRRGNVEISTGYTGFEGERNLFDTCDFPELRDTILNTQKSQENLWYSSTKGTGYVVSRYIDNLGWYLIVENDTTVLNRQLTMQFIQQILSVVITIIVVLLTITSVIRRYNKKIIDLTVDMEKKHQTIFQQATEQLYENIYEIDITHNRSASEATSQYFESLGAPSDIPFDKVLRVIAEKQIKEEYRQGYIDTFDPVNVLESYRNGVENLRYDFMITSDGKNYYWMRIIAHIFFWGDDNSVRMLVYRQNIDDEKRHELFMFEQMQRDSLTGLYNKVASQNQVRRILEQSPDGIYAFYILDIDHFKEVNDELGHAAGDAVLVEFARTLRTQFQGGGLTGRIGGDEFMAFVPVTGRRMAEEKARSLVHALWQKVEMDTGKAEITASLGVALWPESGTDFETLYRKADQALYQAKKQGRNRYGIDMPEHEPGKCT